MDQSLAGFSGPTQSWFRAAFEQPTPAQKGAWTAIAQGRDVLVVAPTGSGKTLSAFLWALDRLAFAASTSEPSSDPVPTREPGTRVLYVSPLKALAVDVERNLRSPLAGIRREAVRAGLAEPEVTVGIRSGDTSTADRRLLQRNPPDVLITTPESLFLMLTSSARETLRTVNTVIIDEVHAVAGTKRGSHLSLSLERLDHLLERPAQRIGLSATVSPIEEVARFLRPDGEVAIVNPPSVKEFDLSVVVPLEDMSALGEPTQDLTGPAAGEARRASIWPHVEERLVDLIEQHRSTIVFANSRRLSERLTTRLNDIAQERARAEDAPGNTSEAGSHESAAPRVIALAHHGSVSREQRSEIEEALKSGRLPAVVATSSLELGIDMGAVDLVVQVESPPSVASGLQRIGRGGHQVGAVSKGIVFPKFRGDLVQAATVVKLMADGALERTRIIQNPLDVLAQQIVAMVAMDDWSAPDLLALVRRSAAFTTLPDSAFTAVLDMLSGKYPSDAFAELRPRIVWDRSADVLHGRPGAQRLAVTSGGTIPDRGLFGVFLVGEKQSRVGELDEEMVYESRVGEVISLGASSWRIEDITHDRVLVSPAPGQPGKLPFWHGDSLGRPAEVGVAVGQFVRETAAATPAQARKTLQERGLDDLAASNLITYLQEQKSATGVVPDDRTIVLERFRDEIGDWRIAIHSSRGGQVHAPWAQILAAVFREGHGMDAQVMPSDDGIVLRLPDTEDDAAINAALAELFIEPEDVERLVMQELGGSALFAARFRECAARALLLPRRDPKRRSPLWQQRQRAAQLLSVASEHASFPMLLETMRECLQDVYDVPALVALMKSVKEGAVRVVTVDTPTPSPFARSLLFGYIATYMYEGDSPLAERRAQALALDSQLLSELLGQADLRELLEPDAMAEVALTLQWLTDERKPRSAEGLADLLRVLGPQSAQDLELRGIEPSWIEELATQRRAIPVRIAGRDAWAAVEDAGRLRDALGTALPVGIPDAHLELVADPLGDLILRYARTHLPFAAGEPAAAFGLGVAVMTRELDRLARAGRLTRGEFTPGGSGHEWCDPEVLRRIRRASISKLRKEIEPVEPGALARFLPRWQSISAKSGELRGPDGLIRAVEQLHGAALPAGALETLVLPSRVADYSPALLDDLLSHGDIVWCGAGSLGGKDGWISLALAEAAADVLPVPSQVEPSTLAQEVLQILSGGGSWLSRDMAGRLSSPATEKAVAEALWELAWAGLISSDTLDALRATTSASSRVQRTPRPRPGRLSRGTFRAPSLPTASGRWFALPSRTVDPTRRAAAEIEALLDRHGIVTRGAVVAERISGGFAAAYRTLAALEERGRCRRGYVVEGLGASQFALPGAIDRVREASVQRPPGEGAPDGDALILAAADPANPYGAALEWPRREGFHPGRKIGAAVGLVDGELSVYLERGGKSLLVWPDEGSLAIPALQALAHAMADGRLPRTVIERVNGSAVLTPSTPWVDLFGRAGFLVTPRGMRARA